MRIAYLFVESYPNYDIDFQVLSALSPDELKSIDTLVRTGVWGLLIEQSGHTIDEVVQTRLVPLFYSGEGHIVNVKDSIVAVLASDKLIYTVQFISLERALAVALHERLNKYENYLGYIQVLVDLPLHHQVLNICEPRYGIEHGDVHALYSSVADDEFIADEIISNWQETHNSLKYATLISSL